MNSSGTQSPKAEPWLAGGLILLVTALSYGILIPQLGFYRDDWYMLWTGQSNLGLSGIIQLFQTDRPLIGWTYAALFKLFHTNTLAWHSAALLCKAGTGLAVLWLMRLLWPTKRLETTCAALLFVLYPGFYQQPVAATFIIDLIGLNAAFISIALTVYALQTSNRWLKVAVTLVSAALALFYVALYEATIGLEVVRWALVWYVVWTTEGRVAAGFEAYRDPLRKVSLRAFWQLIPYLLTIAGFIVWRLFFFESVRRATNINVLLADYASNPLYSLSQILFGYLKDLFETIVSAWFVPFYLFTAEGRYTDFLSALGVTLAVLALVAAYVLWFRRQSSADESDDLFPRHLLLLGLVAVTLPSAVIVVLGRNVLFGTQWDRYTTQSMLGVALLVTGALFYYLRGSGRWTVFFSLLFLAVMTHYHSAAYHARFWNYERNVVWQLAWRAPGLQPGTTIITSLPDGYRLAEEYEVWGPLNMAYSPGQSMLVSGQVPYDGMALDILDGKKESRTLRNLNVKRDYGKPLVLSMPSQNSCLHVLDGQHPAWPYYENPRIKEIAAFSKLDLIDLTATPVTPSVTTFGAEPEHGWCFYYQKMGLALQAGDFAAAALLADETAQKGLKPSDETEWLPVVYAYVNTGQTDKASSAADEIDKSVRRYLCLQQAAANPWPRSSPGSSTGQGYNGDLIRSTLCPGQ
jgi:hypothetical protein